MFKLILTFLFFNFSILALDQAEVVKSSLQHYPDVVNAVLNLEQAESAERSTEGQFDAKIKGGTDSRFDGYYDGKGYKVQVEKPMQFLNSKVYGGYRRSNGEFPLYEGKSVTLDGGETFMGVSLSLLRDSFTDENRFNIAIAREDANQAKFQIDQVRIAVQAMAMRAYWNWVVKGNAIEVYRSLLDLSQKRNKQIKRRIKAGDLARIYATENLQYIRKREVLLKKKLIAFQEASYYLSLFYRDDKGKPIDVSNLKVPKLKQKNLKSVNDPKKVMAIAMENNPMLKIISSQEKQAQAKSSLGKNLMLPKVDLNFEVNKDRGSGSTTLRGQEERLMLNIEIPLEFNKGLGKKREGEFKARQLKNKRSLMMEKMKVKIESLAYKINNTIDIVNLSANQVQLAKKLSKAEYRKFKRGASDLILVNIREENLGESQIKNLESLLKYHYYRADLRQITLDFIL